MVDAASSNRCQCNPTESNGGSSTWCERCEKPKGFAAGPPVAASLADHYNHARRKCGCGRIESIYRAVYAQVTGRWPW
jgi:hypothetical protein